MNKEAYLGKFKVGNPNPDHVVADQIYNGFGKKLAFPRIMSIIKSHGRQFAYQTWSEISKGDAKNPVALFLWKVKNNKIIFN